MTYKELINTIEKVASQQPNIRTIVPFSPYDVNNSKETVYSVFSWSPNAFTESNEFINYSLNLFYIDRLSADSSNKLQIQSIGIKVLKNILDLTMKNGETSCGEIGLPITKSKLVLPCGIYGRWCAK